MAGPPPNVATSELWRKIVERPRPTTTVDFPGKGVEGQPLGQVSLWILTESELHFCRGSADKTAKEILGGQSRIGDLGYEEIYRNELNVQLVSLAARQVGDTQHPVFPSAKFARQYLTTDEFGVLAMAYAEHRRACGPVIAEMTEAEMEAWLRALQEGARAAPFLLAGLSGECKSDLILFLASKLRTPPTDSVSPGSPLGGSSLTSSAEAVRPASELVDDIEKIDP